MKILFLSKGCRYSPFATLRDIRSFQELIPQGEREKIRNGLLFIALSMTTCNFARVIPYISIRSQSVNAARDLVLWQAEINKSCMENLYSSCSFLAEYTRTVQAEHMGQCLFNDALTTACCCKGFTCFQIQGSEVPHRSSNAFLAENFGLPTDFESTISLYPRIENFIFCFDYYLGLDRCAQGLYIRVHLPALHTRWELNFAECNIIAGKNDYPGGYFNGAFNVGETNPLPVPRSSSDPSQQHLVANFENYAVNQSTPNISGIMFHPLEKARFYKVRKDDNKLAEVQMALGWNFFMGPNYHLGLNLRTAAPTGTRPWGEFIFEPIAGNGKHWELGIGLTSHWKFWSCEDEHDSFAVYLDANFTHLFNACQRRTFDLCNKPLSRYMLAAKMKTPSNHLFDAAPPDGTAATYQFADEYTAIANLSTIPVKVSAAIQSDIALKLCYSHKNYQFDLGYEFWQRSCEKICPVCLCEGEVTYWALKGDAFTYGFAVDAENVIQHAIPLSASESDATIFCGTNNAQRTIISRLYWQTDPGVDNAKLAYHDYTDTDGDQSILAYIANPGPGNPNWNLLYSSFQPVIFATNSTAQWDIEAARSKGMSNKIFFNGGYIWHEHTHIVPYLGFGLEAEFGSSCKDRPDETTCTTKNPGDATMSTLTCNNTNKNFCCMSCAISQIGIWFKGGLSF